MPSKNNQALAIGNATDMEIKSMVENASRIVEEELERGKQKKKQDTTPQISVDLNCYAEDINYINNYITPGFITWVQTIDPALFLSFMSLWPVAKLVSRATAKTNTYTFGMTDTVRNLPVIQSAVLNVSAFSTFDMLSFTKLFETAQNTPATIDLLKTSHYSYSISSGNSQLSYRTLIDSVLLPAFRDAAKEKPESAACIETGSELYPEAYIFQVRALDYALMNFVTELQELFYTYWRGAQQNSGDFLPRPFVKVILVPAVDLLFPSYFRRKALYVDFDKHIPVSPFCKEFKRAMLLKKSSQDKLNNIHIPLTLLEQTATYFDGSADIGPLIKDSLVHSCPGLSVVENLASADDVVGYGRIKKWIERMKLFVESPEYEKSQRPRGVLLVGMPGTGKTTFCKVMASMFKWPLINMDIGQMKAGIQGETEHNIQSALQTLKVLNKCILQIDEVEKALGGTASSNVTDGGTLMGILNKLLQFMDSNDHSVIVVMTANSVADIPPALMRSGRIDLWVYAELPKKESRKEIIANYLRKAKFSESLPADALDQLANFSDGYSGAELESAVYHAKWKLVSEKKFHSVSGKDLYRVLLDHIREIKPVSKSREDDLEKVKEWAEKYAITTEE